MSSHLPVVTVRFLTAGKEPWGQQVFSKSRRAWRIMHLRREGTSVKGIVRRFGVRPRRVQRSLNAITSQDLKVGTDN